MSKLLQVEHAFQNYLLEATSDIFKHVIGTKKVPVEVRLAIYSNAYRSRLHEALQANYPILERYLGYDAFLETAYAYSEHHPSTFRSIRWFGNQLASFLQTHSLYKDYPHIAELAQFEWTMTEVFDAADANVISHESMQAIPLEAWVDMRLSVHPSLKLLLHSWNTVQLWQAIKNEENPEEPCKTAPVTWALWRNGLISRFSSLPEDEAWAMKAMMQGSSFGEICEGICQWVEEQQAGLHAASLLKGWINAGLITEVII
jgi:hypothetical protein